MVLGLQFLDLEHFKISGGLIFLWPPFNEIKEEVENLENVTKEGIYQFKATVQHQAENMLP